MNIGIINTFSHTKSTGKIAYGLYSYLSKENNVTLFYGEPDEEPLEDENIVLISSHFSKNIHIYQSLLFGDQGRHSTFRTKKLLHLLDNKNIKVLYLFNIHGYYLNYHLLFKYIAKRNIKVIYVMLDEHAFAGKCCFTLDCEKYTSQCNNCPNLSDYPKSYFFDRSKSLFISKQKFYSKTMDITFVGIPYTANKARSSTLLKNKKIVDLEEGINLTNIYYPRDVLDLRKKLGIKDNQIVLLLVAPFSHDRKGAIYFLEAAKRYKDDKRFVFVNVGYDGDLNSCPENFIPVPYVADQNELAVYYSLADCFICTSLAETVADTCLESLACGTPIIGFSNSGLPLSVKEEHCLYIESKNVDALVSAIEKVKKKDLDIQQSCRKYAEDHFDFEHYMSELGKLSK